MKDVKSIVAKNLTNLRKKNKLTQADLAQKLNYSDKAISRWEHGETLPDINVLYELCDFYGITLNDLVSEGGDVKSPEQKEKYSRAYRLWFCILTVAIILLLATVVFIYNPKHWTIFVWAIPISCGVVLHMLRGALNWIVKFILSSVIAWSIIVGIFLELLLAGTNTWLLFIVGLPLEAVLFLWQKMQTYKGYIKEIDNDKSRNEKSNTAHGEE